MKILEIKYSNDLHKRLNLFLFSIKFNLMKIQSFFFLFFVGILFLFTSSCSPSAMLPGTNTSITGTMADSKLKPPPGKSLVYIVRSSPKGFAVEIGVEMDGKVIGSNGGKQFLYTYAEPGKHIFLGLGENLFELPIILEAGKTYFIEQKLKAGLWQPRTKLIRIDNVIGRTKLLKCRLSADNATLEGFL